VKSNTIIKIKLPKHITDKYGLERGAHKCQVCGDWAINQAYATLIEPYGLGVVGRGIAIMCADNEGLDKIIFKAIKAIKDEEKARKEWALEQLERIFGGNYVAV